MRRRSLRGSPVRSGQGGGQRPARPGCGFATDLWRLGECAVMLEEAGEGSIYRRARRGDRTLPKSF